MNVVTPVDLHTLSRGRRARIALEVLVTYVRVRWVMRGRDVQRAVGQLRGGVAQCALDGDLQKIVAVAGSDDEGGVGRHWFAGIG